MAFAVATVACMTTLGIAAAPASAFVLTVDLEGAGSGGVTSSPAGINCSNTPGSEQTDCSFTFPNFTQVTLTATPSGSFIFSGWSGTAGGTCGSGSANPCQTNPFQFSNASATATFGLPPDPPGAMTDPAQPVGPFSAVLRGRVNPNDFAVGDCYFEIGTSTDYRRKYPCAPSDLGSGSSDVAVRSGSGTLRPGTTYRFRLVAKNVGGTSVGEDQTFTTPAYTENLSPLPGYGYELVSPPMAQGQRATPLLPVPGLDGDEVAIRAAGGLPGSEWLDGTGMTYIAQRHEGKWLNVPISPSGVDYPNVGNNQPGDWSADGQQMLWLLALPGQQNSDLLTPVVRDRQGAEQIAGPTLVLPPGVVGATDQYVGGSDDLKTLVFQTRARPALTGGGTDNRAGIFKTLIVVRRASDGTFTVRPVAHQAGTAMFENCEAMLGSDGRSGLGAVSNDGRKIFFSPDAKGIASCRTPAMTRVWAKVDDNDPIDISAPQCSPGGCSATSMVAQFEGASDDGNRVYFSTEQELLDGDGDTSLKRDLFEYTFAPGGGGTLRAVTSSGTPVGAGVVRVARVSADGSHVYFVATGQPLVTTPNERGAVPVAGDTNLYVSERQPGEATGTTAFVGKLDPSDGQVFNSDSSRTVQTSDDGRFVTFVSRADLAGDRLPGDAHLDVFRYDAERDDLRRIWSDAPNVNGEARVAGAYLAVCECSGSGGARNKALRGNNYMSQDGAVIGFSTTEALDPRDQNTTNDAYVWTAATDAVHVVSSGRGNEYQDQFNFVSRSGDMIGFSSATGLVPEHTSGQTAAYVLRRGGGFPLPQLPPEPCVPGDPRRDCQPPTPPPGAPTGPVGSGTFVGPGNVLLESRESPKSSARIRVSKIKTVRRTSTRAKVRVPDKGKIRVSGRNLVRTSKTVRKSGTVRVLVKLTKRGKQKLRRDGRVKTRVNVRFVPEKGTSMRKRVSVTFRTRATKRKASSRSTRTSNVPSSDAQKGR